MSKELIFEVNLELLRIKSKKQFYFFLNNALRKLFRYSHTTIFLRDATGEGLINYFASSSGEIKKQIFCDWIDLEKFDDNSTLQTEKLSQTLLDATTMMEAADTYVVPSEYSKGWILQKQDLHNGSEVIGCWIMLYAERSDMTQPFWENLPEINSLLKTAYDNVTGHEDLAQRELENEIVQSLTTDLALIKDKSELLKIIHAKLKNVFDYIDHFVAVVNEDKSSVTSFLQDTRSWVDEHPNYQQSVYAKYPFNDGIFNRVILSKDPHVFDLIEESERGNMPQYFQILFDSGIKTVIMIGLHVRDRMIGLWCICRLESYPISKHSFRLIKNVANQLAISVENIMANETILQREKERRYILKLSESFALVRTKGDMHKVVSKVLRPLFPAQDIVFLKLDDDGSYSSLFIFSDRFDAASDYHASLRHKISSDDLWLEKVNNSNGAVVINLEHLKGFDRLPKYLQIEIEHGVREKVCVRLRDDKSNIGAFFINSTRLGEFNDHTISLVEAISFQISIAIAKTLGLKDNSVEPVPDSILLSLTNEISRLRNRNDLFALLDNRFVELFPINKLCFVQWDETKSIHQVFNLKRANKDDLNNEWKVFETNASQEADSILRRIKTSSSPVTLNVERIVSEANSPSYINFWLQCGFLDIVCVSTTIDGSPNSIVCFNVDFHLLDASRLALLNAVCFQLASKVSNFIAIEELTKREEELNLLKASLEFSSAFAPAIDRKTLASIFSQELRKIRVFDDYSLWLLSIDKSRYSILELTGEGLVTESKEMSKEEFSLNETESIYTAKVLNSYYPVTFDINSITDPVPDFVAKWRSGAITEVIGASVEIPDVATGILWILSASDSQVSTNQALLKNLCLHFNVALGRVLAREQMLQHIDLVGSFNDRQGDVDVNRDRKPGNSPHYPEIVGNGPEIQKTFRLIAQVSPSDSTVLLLGETGTGKELIARVIHENSSRKAKPMVKVNCAALPASLIESELFGHERGSFTGAIERKIGKFEQANGGTLFLDEIGEMSLDLQVKLLRALQEKEIDRIGGKGYPSDRTIF